MAKFLALSLKQPWARLMTSGPKRVENRSWQHTYRGIVLVHASKKFDLGGSDGSFIYAQPASISKNEFSLTTTNIGKHLPFPADMSPFISSYETGGIVGMFEIYDCVSQSDDPWFFGPYGFLTRNNKPLPFVACKGALGFWTVPDEVIAELRQKGAEL